MSKYKLMAQTLFLALLFTGCAHSNIQGTEIPDTDDNRQIMGILHTMQEAFHRRDGKALLSLVSTTYFEDMGTADQADDYGYEYLKDSVIPNSLNIAKEIYLSFTVHEIIIEGEMAHADIRYKSRAKLELASGAMWDSHKEFNRIEFTLEEGRWLIKAGL